MHPSRKYANFELLLDESANAVARMRTSQDLENRIGVLQDRAEVASPNLVPFLVAVPPAAKTEEDRKEFIQNVGIALQAIVNDAELDIRYNTLDRVMREVGLGDHDA